MAETDPRLVLAAGGKPYDPRRGVRPPARRARLPTGPARSPRRKPSATSSSTTWSCTVTGSTHAGMIAGFALEGTGRRSVIGIDASKTLRRPSTRSPASPTTPPSGSASAGALRPEEIRIVDGAGPVYGIPNDGTIEAIHLAARHGGHAHRPGLRGQVDGRADRHGQVRVRSPLARRCYARTWAGNLPCPPTPGRPAWGEEVNE